MSNLLAKEFFNFFDLNDQVVQVNDGVDFGLFPRRFFGGVLWRRRLVLKM
jgi:hypothetical protein